jgi:hypothetical protein
MITNWVNHTGARIISHTGSFVFDRVLYELLTDLSIEVESRVALILSVMMQDIEIQMSKEITAILTIALQTAITNNQQIDTDMMIHKLLQCDITIEEEILVTLRNRIATFNSLIIKLVED